METKTCSVAANEDVTRDEILTVPSARSSALANVPLAVNQDESEHF
jgi:hypothetical protein